MGRCIQGARRTPYQRLQRCLPGCIATDRRQVPSPYFSPGHEEVSGPPCVNLALTHTLLTAIIVLVAIYGGMCMTVTETTIGTVPASRCSVSVAANGLRVSWSGLLTAKATSITTTCLSAATQSNFARRLPVLDIALSAWAIRPFRRMNE